ncbi:hypothetical protein [Actinacidiphila epipremni]|uniref:Uncharacterized protein n=1 Tax=Actinacidiphila epipremni TaxID=2053013 RepID=A0ABX0ZV46_9ACTN|nr:hypothetical protein [Actinacidiphila epipremni]NJP47899.1 hypothetical protein [Actinacidiphila epipremni]
MPTPHGTRGGLAFSADEVRVLRRALAEVLHPSRTAAQVPPAAPPVPRPAQPPGTPPAPRAAGTPYARDYLRLAEALDDAARESGRLRAFLRAEVRRYREALPGAAAGYLERLTAAVAAGDPPGAEDLAALRSLRAQATGSAEHHRRAALLALCEDLARTAADPFAGPFAQDPAEAAAEVPAENLAHADVPPRLEAHMPAPRRLFTFPGPSAAEPDSAPRQPAPKPGPKPAPPAPEPGRRTPTPAEIWPPNRRPTPPPAPPKDLLAPRRAG